MSGTYDQYLREVGVLARLSQEWDRALQEARQLGSDDLRDADRRVAEVKDETRRAEEVLRTSEQRLARISRARALPAVSTPGTLRLTSITSVTKALSELDRELDSVERSADWLQRNRSAVAVAPVRPTSVVQSAAQPPGEAVPTVGATSVTGKWWLWAAIAAVLMVGLVVVLVVK